MSGIATAIVGSAIIGGVVSSRAAKGAAQTQKDAAQTASDTTLQAAREANALQWQMYQQAQATQSPYLQGGQMGYSALLGAMGLGSPTATGAPQYGSAGAQVGQGGRAQAGGAGGLVPNTAAGRATALGVNATQDPMYTSPADYADANAGRVRPLGVTVGEGAMTNRMVADGGPTSVGIPATNQDPTFNIPGVGDVGIQNFGATTPQLEQANQAFSGQLARQFNNQDLNAQMAPNYEFQLQQGLQALKANRAASGSLQTGQGLKDINDYAQNQASGAYAQAFSNWNTQQNQLYARLQGIVAPGSAAAANSATGAQNVGAGIAGTTMGGANASSNYLTGGAAANAAGQVGSANAWSNAIGSGAQGLAGYSIYNKLAGGGAAPAVAPGVIDAGTPMGIPVG